MGVLQKWGNSLGVRVPKGFADQLGLGEGAEVDITLRDGAIMIRPAQRHYVLSELLAHCRPEKRPEPVDWTPAAGRKIL